MPEKQNIEYKSSWHDDYLDWVYGFDGEILFFSKTKLIEHYEKTLGAVHIGGHRMIIYEQEAQRLIQKYFPNY